jgi:hypothetical protein
MGLKKTLMKVLKTFLPPCTHYWEYSHIIDDRYIKKCHHCKEVRATKLKMSDILISRDEMIKEIKFQIERNKMPDENKKPYKCLVCDGKGKTGQKGSVEHGIAGYEEYCYPCKGKGIVWG